jgi:uncharacterized phage protein (TIGR01671 family)
MRKIKFRGKRKDNGEWIYGYYVYTNELHRIIYEDREGFYVEKEVIPQTVGQYTGDKDISRKEIYEGDILHCLDDGAEFYSEVFFEESTFLVCDNNGVKAPVVIYTKNWPAACEKEGNKFDNPELIQNVGGSKKDM